ncbi:MAG TPA: hypothetical protein VHS99_14945 [Chloroflexota bacterium]|nr:hypothetical protein [Chloroflexota bacterium]
MLVVVLGVAAASVVPEVGRWPGPAALAQTIAGEATPATPAQVTVPDATAGRPRLLRAQQDIFLVEGRRRRWVVSPQVFTDYRFGEAWVEQVSEAELTSIPLGPDLVAGPVLRAPDGEVRIVYDGTRPRSLAPSVAEAPGPPERARRHLECGIVILGAPPSS